MMNKEFSAGAIIYKKDGGRPLFLLVYSNRNKIWGFPKGHIEPGESEKEAAIRETREEIGSLDLRFVDGFREEDIYKATSNRGEYKGQAIEKHSVYFLCEYLGGEIAFLEEEITDSRWLPLEDAQQLLSFGSLKTLLEKAAAAIAIEYE